MRPALAFALATLLALPAFAWVTIGPAPVRGTGPEWTPAWEALMGHRLRGEGRMVDASQWGSKSARYAMRVETVEDVQEVIDLFAKLERGPLRIRLHRSEAKPEPAAGAIAPAELRDDAVDFGPHIVLGPKLGAALETFDVEVHRQWYDNLPVNEAGEKVWGPRILPPRKTVYPVTLALCIDHPAVDLDRLVIPDTITVVPAPEKARDGEVEAPQSEE